MTRRDLTWRLAGVTFLAGAGATSLLHRNVLAGAAGQPASLVEMGLAFASFFLASIGVLLMINGVRLRDEWRSNILSKKSPHREKSSGRSAETVQLNPFCSERVELAAWLARRGLDAAAVAHHAADKRHPQNDNAGPAAAWANPKIPPDRNI